MTAPAVVPDYRLGPVLPHVKRAAEIVGPAAGITTIGGWRASARDVRGHPAGLALDYMCTVPQGNKVVSIHQNNADALAVDYLIWQQRIWTAATGQWEDMEDRGSPTQNHMDHVHVNYKVLPGRGPVETGGLVDLGTLSPSSSSVADGWQDSVLSIGLKLVATLAALGLVVYGAQRGVSPGRN